MGFSGGGSNVLKPHTHDGSIAQDGGALNMDGITQGSLTAGDVVFSDGSNLQRLAIGSASDQLRVNVSASAPEWFTPAGAAGWTELASVGPLGASGTLESGTFAAMDSLYCQIYAAQTNQTVKFNSDNSANYNWRGQANNGAQSTRSAVSNGIIYLYDTATSSNFALAQMFISNDADSKKLVIINTTESNGTGNTVPNQEFCWGSFNDDTNQITSIQWGNDGASLTNAAAGSYMKVYGC
jgi:hypothetical protein